MCGASLYLRSLVVASDEVNLGAGGDGIVLAGQRPLLIGRCYAR